MQILKEVQGPVLILLMVWVGHYWHSNSFGLYEDDWTIIPRAARMTFGELWTFIGSYIANLQGHARPLSDSFIYLFGSLGWKLGGLPGVYLLGYGMISLNGVLLYALLRRVHSCELGILGGLAYSLYGADTTQAFITHSLGLHPSLTLLLLAFHAYLSKRRWLAYMLVFVILFSYETPFLVFLAAPLFQEIWDRKLAKELGWHTTVLVAMLAGVYAFRALVGEGRVSGLGFPDLLLLPLNHILLGPLVSLGSFFYRPLQVLQALNPETLLASAGGLLVFTAMFSRLGIIPGSFQLLALSKKAHKMAADGTSGPESRKLLKLGIAGLVMLVCAYPLTFTVRAYALSGRDTRVHFAAVVGAAVLVACLGWWLLSLGRKRSQRILCAAILAALFAQQLGFGFLIQKDYTLAWQYQQDFWAQILPLISDARQGTVILVKPDGLQDTQQIDANTWKLPEMLVELYQVPADWEKLPRVYRLTPDWPSNLLTSDNLFRLNFWTVVADPSLNERVSSTNVIMIETAGGKFTRKTDPLTSGDVALPFQSASQGGLDTLEVGIGYRILFSGR